MGGFIFLGDKFISFWDSREEIMEEEGDMHWSPREIDNEKQQYHFYPAPIYPLEVGIHLR